MPQGFPLGGPVMRTEGHTRCLMNQINRVSSIPTGYHSPPIPVHGTGASHVKEKAPLGGRFSMAPSIDLIASLFKEHPSPLPSI